jgi:hypothetical protein
MARYDDIRNGKNPGVYDIVKEYDWTSVPRTSDLRNEAPSAFITAYELQYSQLRSFIDGYMNILSPQNNAGSYTNSKNPGLDFYKGLYTVKNNAIARLNFPFFEDSFRSFSTEFADTFSPISQRGAQMFGGKEIQGLGAAGESLVGGGVAAVNALASFGDTGNSGDQSLADKVAKTVSGAATGVTKALGLNPGRQTIGTPGSYIETPKFYQYSNTDNGLQIGFTLSNTLEDDSIDKNFKFICDFTKMNRPYRYGPIGMDFPAIYNLVVPGLRYIQWAYLENFEVSLLGNRRRIGTRVIPEAYVCNFTFRSLTVEPANFVEEICDNRDAFGDFDRYSANQAKEEQAFQKGKYQRERTLNKRSDLARAIRTGDQLPNVYDEEPGQYRRSEGRTGDPNGISVGNGAFIDTRDNSPSRGRTIDASGNPVPDPRQISGEQTPVAGPGPTDPSYKESLSIAGPFTGPNSANVSGDPNNRIPFPSNEVTDFSAATQTKRTENLLNDLGIPLAPDGESEFGPDELKPMTTEEILQNFGLRPEK